jgi:hypothetical protein
MFNELKPSVDLLLSYLPYIYICILEMKNKSMIFCYVDEVLINIFFKIG